MRNKKKAERQCTRENTFSHLYTDKSGVLGKKTGNSGMFVLY